MKYRTLLTLLSFLLVPAAYGQMTQVTAQVKDANGELYVNCQWSVVFVNQNTIPGAGPSQPAALLVGQQGHCDSSGNLVVSLADNVLTIQPKPSQWNFSICSAPGYIPGGTYCRSNMLVTVTGLTQNLTAFFQPLMPLLPPLGGGGGGGITGATPGGGLVQTGTTLGMLRTCVQGQFLGWNGTAWACASSAAGGTTVTVNGTAPIPNVLNFNAATPAAPAGNVNVVFQLSGNQVSGYVPAGGGGGGGVSGSGANGIVPVWTGATTLGNSVIVADPVQIQLGNGNSNFLTPTSGGAGVIAVVRDATPTCSGTTGAPVAIGCKGMEIDYNNNTTGGVGTSAALLLNTLSATTSTTPLGAGLVSLAKAGQNVIEETAGVFQSFSGFFANQITNFNRGLEVAAINLGGAIAAQPTNEGLIVQTGIEGSNGTTTLDYTIHCMAPVIGGQLAGGMVTHACLKVDAQASGVEMQLGPHPFAALPACSAIYEGSIAAITDSTVTTGIITGGGTNHVLAYCNGTSWNVIGL